jgi:hypothetical protein
VEARAHVELEAEGFGFGREDLGEGCQLAPEDQPPVVELRVAGEGRGEAVEVPLLEREQFRLRLGLGVGSDRLGHAAVVPDAASARHGAGSGAGKTLRNPGPPFR